MLFEQWYAGQPRNEDCISVVVGPTGRSMRKQCAHKAFTTEAAARDVRRMCPHLSGLLGRY